VRKIKENNRNSEKNKRMLLKEYWFNNFLIRVLFENYLQISLQFPVHGAGIRMYQVRAIVRIALPISRRSDAALSAPFSGAVIGTLLIELDNSEQISSCSNGSRPQIDCSAFTLFAKFSSEWNVETRDRSSKSLSVSDEFRE